MYEHNKCLTYYPEKENILPLRNIISHDEVVIEDPEDLLEAQRERNVSYFMDVSSFNSDDISCDSYE